MALGRLALLWGLHWAGCVLVVAGGKSTWLDLSCHPGPNDIVLLPGQEAIVHCDVGNTEGDTNVTWWKNGETLNTENLTVLPNGGLLLSQGAGSSVEGRYSCMYRNSFGVVKGRMGTIRLAGLPPFYMHPDPQIVHQGSLARFECGISGTPPAQITWQKDQSQLPASKRFAKLPSGVLLISRVQPEDAGLYRCVAANVVKTRYSNEAQLSVEKDLKLFPGELAITRTPQNLTREVGQSAVMECSAEGSGMPVVSWFRQDGNPLSSDIILLGESNLLIKHIQAHHAGVYLCRASYPHSQHFVTATAHLQVLVPPFITQPPEVITRARAGTARFICSATGNPDPIITWLKNGKQLSSNGRVRIQPRGSLVITQIDLEDAGYYQCVAKNILGSACATTRLHVTVQDGQPGPPQDLRALAVTSKTVTVTWERPQSNWERVIGFSLHYTKTGGTENMEYQFAVNNDTTELNVKYLEPGTNYTFYVVAYSPQGASRASEPLVVQTWDDVPAFAPMLSLNSETPEDIHVKWLTLQPELTNGHITKYRIEYITQKDGVVSMVEVKGNETGVTLSSLQPSTVYKVRISASTSAGYGAPSNWVLQRTLDRVNQTQVPPSITQPPEIITREQAGTAHFICSATGDPDPLITWLKNGKQLFSNERVRIQPTGSLVITQIDLEDAGYYQCVAKNILGSAFATTRLHVIVQEGLPGPPQDLRALAVTSKTVTVTWERPQSNWERVIRFSLHYTKTGGTENMEYQFAVNNDTTELNVKYLEPGTNYSFYVVAYSQQGASRASEPLVVRTRDDVPEAAPMLSVNSETPEDIHVKWLPLQPELTNGHITKYRIEYTTQKDGVVSMVEVKGNETGVMLSSLQPSTVYKVRITASTSAGYGAPSNWVLLRTLDRVNQTQVEQAQVQLKVIAHTDSLFVSWQLPHTDLLITGYRLYYRMMCPALDPAASCPWQGKNDWDHGPIKLKKKRKQYEITDLIPGQLYQVRLVAYYKKQEVQTVVWEGKTRQIPTAPPDFKAQRIPPLPPSHIQVEPNSSTSVWMKWRKPIISSRIVNYTIRCGPWGAKNASQFTYHSSVMEEILISGLKPFTRYEFAVQSNGAGVDGPYSNIVEKMTLPDRPSSPPADLLLQPLSHSSVQVHWRPPLESNGIILQYLILYTANRSHPDEMWTLLTKEGNVFSTEVQDLQSGSKYYFKMGAKTASGWGPYSQVVEVETLPPRLPDVLDMNSVTGIIVGVCLCLLCLLLCMCASFQQGKQRDSGSELGPRTSRGPSSYQRARQGSCSQSRCQDSHELETLMPPRQEDTPSLPIPEVTELIGGLISNPQLEEKNQLKMKTSWNGSITQNWANHITSYAETIPGELANAANGSANHLTTGGIRMILHDISYESHKVDVGRNHRNPSQNQVEADVIVHSDFSVSERSGHCAGLDSEEEEEEISLDHDKGPIECLTPTSNPHTQPVATESESQDWSNQPLVAISTEHTLNIMATKTPHLANGIPRTGDSQDNQTVTGSPFTTDCGDSCSEDVPLTSRAQQESPLNSPVLPLVLNSEETVH